MADAAERIFQSVRDAPQKGAPLYLQLKQRIEEAIDAGVIGPGDACRRSARSPSRPMCRG